MLNYRYIKGFIKHRLDKRQLYDMLYVRNVYLAVDPHLLYQHYFNSLIKNWK